MPSKSRFIWVSDTLTPGLVKSPVTLRVALRAFTSYQSSKVQDFMRSNAPWTDRTGNARGGLFASARSDGNGHTIVIYHTVPYGIWLEVAHGGQYAIITPTLRVEGRRIMSELSHFLGKMNKVA